MARFESDCNTEITGFFQASGGELMMDSLSDMVLRGQAIQVHLEPLDRLESLMVEVQEWKESAAATFLQKDSALTLLEVTLYTFCKVKLDNFFALTLSFMIYNLIQQCNSG